MRSVLVLLGLLLLPGSASAHAGHPGQPHEEAPPSNATAPGPSPRPAPAAPAPAAPLALGRDSAVPSPGTQQWLGFKGDALRTGATGAKVPDAPLKKWDAQGTAGVGIYAPPVVARGLVVFAGLDRMVHAVDAATGFRQWSAELPAMVYASPAVVDDKVLVVAGDGTLVAFDLLGGAERWRLDLGDRSSAAPVLVNGIGYALTESGRVVAFDAADGKVRWNRTLAPVESVVSPMWMAGRVIVGDARGQVHALHALTGQVLWTAQLGAPVTATPVGAGRMVVVPTLGLKGLEPESGRILWSLSLGAFVRSSPAYHAGVLVYGDPEEPGVVAANALDGKRLWQAPTRLFVRSPPAIGGDVAVAAADDGSLLALRLRNGSLLWSLDAGERMRASPVLFDGSVVAARMDGVVRLFTGPGTAGAGPPGDDEPADRDGLLNLLAAVAVLGAPYAGIKVLRGRLKRGALAPTLGEPASARLPSSASTPPPAPAGAPGFVRVACPRCACRFGLNPRLHAVVACPGCGLRSEVRQRTTGRGGSSPTR